MRQERTVSKGRLRTWAATGAALAVSSAGALAADMPVPPVYKAPPPVEILSGWYLRGDLGAHWGVVDGAQSVSPFRDATGNGLGQGVNASLGFGIKTQWLRTDITIDYVSPLKYSGTVATPDDTTAKIQTFTTLLNGYLDLGTWYRLSPYVGAGVGAAYADLYDYASTGAPPFSGDTSNKRWGFAWAAMAGVAYPISHNLMLDVGYRYLNIGDVSSGSDAFGAMTFKNVAGHEARVGLRWWLDDLH